MARFIGHYEVIKELGVGQFGAVCLAVGDVPSRAMLPSRRRIVAIKQLKEPGNREALRLLLQEFALLDQVKHRGIVRVYEYLEDERAVIMEHIHGVTLRDVIDDLRKSREQFFTEAAVEVGCELADALYQAYTTPGDNGEPLRLVHRDLKPANIMLLPNGEVKILDFGLARVDNRDYQRDGRAGVKGTPIYMAPEQARSEEVDHRTDLFSTGLILYELLMSRPAYQVSPTSNDPAAEILRAIETGDLREQCITLDQTLPALGPIVSRLLQPQPDSRYRSGHDLLVDLKRQLYKDRGAYLKEFCEFYFGSIHPIGDAPNVETAGSGARGKRRTLEERLRDSMSRDTPEPEAAPAPAPPPVVSSMPGRARGPASPRSSAPSVPTAPPVPVAPPAPRPPPSAPSQEGEPMSSSAGGRKPPPRPPVGGPASRATPFEPNADSAARKDKKPPSAVGERRPDEAGMLEMVPLATNRDAAEASEDPSATAFFAIPAPKADRSRPSGGAPPPSMGGGPIGAGPIGVLPPGAGGSMPPGALPPPVARPPMGISQGGQPPVAPQPLVQGPVHSYGGNQQSPFAVGGPGPVGGSTEAGQRVQSNRVYAIIVAVFLLVGAAVVLAIWLGPKRQEVVEDTPPVVSQTPKAAPRPEPKVDTGEAPAAPVQTPKPKPRGTTPAAPKPAPAASGPATLTVRLADAGAATSVEVVCPGGFRQRAAFGGGAGSIASVPQEKCTLYFKGGAPAQYTPVHGGMSVNCSIIGTTAVCK